MLYLPFNDPEACYRMVKEFGDKKGVIGFMITAPPLRGVYDNAYARPTRRSRSAACRSSFHAAFNWARSQGIAQSNRFIAVHALGFAWFNMLHMTNWLVNGMPERFPQPQDDLDRERPRLGAVPDAAARQRIHDALLGVPGAEAEAERLHARDVFHHASRWRWSTTARRWS